MDPAKRTYVACFDLHGMRGAQIKMKDISRYLKQMYGRSFEFIGN